MELPTLIDISPTNLAVLDERTAYEHFSGKTKTEAVAMFRESEEIYADDLVWMGGAAFDYYVDAYIIHLMSAEESGVDICLAMHVVVTRTQMDRATNKLSKLIETIKIYGKPTEPCDSELAREFAEITHD